MSKELTVSVITASFNRGKFIEKAILSIKNQDYPLIEHIIVDGGSTDNTLDVLKKYDGTYNLKWREGSLGRLPSLRRFLVRC